MWELKRNFPAQSGAVYARPFFLSLGPLFFSPSSFCAPSTSPLPSLQSGVCLMKLSREGPPSFCSAATHYTPLASSALFRHELCVVPRSASVSTYSPCLFHDSRDQPFQHFSLANRLSLSCTSVSAVVYMKVAWYRVEWLKDVSRRTVYDP